MARISKFSFACFGYNSDPFGLNRPVVTSTRRSEPFLRIAISHEHGWKLPRAIFGSPEHPLKIGNLEIPCYVLEDNRRVLTQRGMVFALDMARGSSGGTGGDRLAKFVEGDRLKSFVSKELQEVTSNPIKFLMPSGNTAYGYEATVLADICDVVLLARKAGLLQKQR